MLILIADDDPDTCTLVAAIVQRAGHEVVFARDAMQVMFMAQNRKPDVVLLDLLMPAGTGIGALQKLKQSGHTKHIPVIVLSGVTDQATIDRSVEIGARAFLAKPVDDAALLEALADVAAEQTDDSASA